MNPAAMDLNDRLQALAKALEWTLREADKFGPYDSMRTYELAGYLKEHGQTLLETLQEAEAEILPPLPAGRHTYANHGRSRP